MNEALSLLETVADSLTEDRQERRSLRKRLWENEDLVHWVMDQLRSARKLGASHGADAPILTSGFVPPAGGE